MNTQDNINIIYYCFTELTCQRKKLNVSYGKLVSVFGKPEHESKESRIDKKWVLQLADGITAIVFNWKGCINDWCIGGCKGSTTDAIDLIKQAVEANESIAA